MEELKYLWRFYFDYGRSGSLDGLFVATETEVRDLIGEYVYFGEVLGKHSEVYGYIQEYNISKLDLDSDIVVEVSEILGETWSGFNPTHYLRYDCPICEEGNFHYEEFNHETKTCYDCEDKVNE